MICESRALGSYLVHGTSYAAYLDAVDDDAHLVQQGVMACEARIVRVLRTLEYPEAAALSPQTLMQNPEELARVVSWVEDRKV